MPLTIAYLGPEKTNTHQAAIRRFGVRTTYIHAPTIDDVFHLVEREAADYGVVPIENSLGGAVTHTLDRFIDFKHSPVTIHGEIEQPIHHTLIVHRGVPLTHIEVVYSHPQALDQCGLWLQQHLPFARREETNSTAEAVAYLRRGRGAGGTAVASRQRAAIARGDLATGELRGIEIPQDRENKTRFLIIGLGEPKRGKRNKTSILFALKDRPGALHDTLVPFKRNRINLTKIESRPSRRKAWEYLFFIDLEGHEAEPRVKRALGALEKHTTVLRVLGSYPLSPRGRR